MVNLHTMVAPFINGQQLIRDAALGCHSVFARDIFSKEQNIENMPTGIARNSAEN